MANPFTDLQTGSKNLLINDAYFIGDGAPPVITEDIGDIENEISKAVNEIGISVVVLTPKTEPGKFPGHVTVTVLFGISEDVTINRAADGDGDPIPPGTQKPASDVGAKIWAIIQGRSPGLGWTPFVVEGMNTVSTGPLLVYEVLAKTSSILRAA